MEKMEAPKNNLNSTIMFATSNYPKISIFIEIGQS